MVHLLFCKVPVSPDLRVSPSEARHPCASRTAQIERYLFKFEEPRLESEGQVERVRLERPSKQKMRPALRSTRSGQTQRQSGGAIPEEEALAEQHESRDS